MMLRLRTVLFAVAVIPATAALLAALGTLPSFGTYRSPYGDLVLRTVLEMRHIPQGVAAVTFDYRGFDTLGEEFILFAAVAGALLLMRPQAEEHRGRAVDEGAGRRVPAVSAAVRFTGLLIFPLAFLQGVAMVVHGHLTPGGGFQGGVLVASSFYFVYLSGEYEDFTSVAREHALDLLEAAGAVLFALLAIAPLVTLQPFMFNMLPAGAAGELVSGGTIPLFNGATGLEVAAAFLLLISGFLRQALVLHRGRRK